jgi:hypothetical protein
MEWLVGLQTAASQHLNSAREPRAASTDYVGSIRDISLSPDLGQGSLGDCHEEFRVHPWRVFAALVCFEKPAAAQNQMWCAYYDLRE